MAGCGNSGGGTANTISTISSTTSITSSANSTTPTRTSIGAKRTVAAILARGGGPLHDAFYACLLNGFLQGLPLDKVKKDCETKLKTQDFKGVETGPFGQIPAELYDPTRVSANCAAGDAGIGQSVGQTKVDPYGWYSWGKWKGHEQYEHGLTQEESKRQKEEAIREYEKAAKESEEESKKFDELEKKAEEAEEKAKEAKKTGDQAKIEEARKAAKEAKNAAVEQAKKAIDASQKATRARDEAKADPNQKRTTVNRPSREPTACEEGLQAAREALWECHRTQWKSPPCQELAAKMSGTCPDPTQIYVDPEQGYACGLKVDEKALKEAWVARCEELHDPGPDGQPCQPPTLDESQRYILDGKLRAITNVCHDPRALVVGGAEECLGPLVVKEFGVPDVHRIIVWGLNKLGGPIVVIPTDRTSPLPPHPGPRPDPNPNP